MTLATIFGIIIVFQIVLNYLILSRGNHRKETNIWFAGMNTSLIVWILTIIFANSDFDYYIISLTINKLAFVAIFSFTFFLFLFVKSFSKVSFQVPKLLTRYFILSTAIWTFLILFTDGVVKGLIRVEERYDIDRDGDLYLYFLGFTLLHLFISIVLLWLKTRKAKNKDRNMLRTVLVGLILISVIVVLTNAVIPLFTGTTQSSDFGPLAIIIWLTVIFYNIRANQFLDTRLLIGRLFYYLILGSISYAAFYFFSILLTGLFGSIYNPGAYILGVLNAGIFVILLDTARKFFQRQINIKFINPGYDPVEIVNSYNSKINTVLDIDELANITLDTFSSTVRASAEAILVTFSDSDKRLYTRKELPEINRDVLEEAYQIWEHAGDVPINIDIYETQLTNEFRNMKNWLEPIIKEMKKNSLKLLVPLKITANKDYIGMIILGPKESDIGYDTIETQFVMDLASSLSSALARSDLHKEVQELNQNLQKKVEEATAELKQKVLALEDARRRERDMLDILGHELRTPLTIVRNAIQLMKNSHESGNLDDEMLGQYLEMADENTKREVSLLETMLTTTKIDNNSLSLVLTKVHLNDVVDDSFAALTQKAERKGLKLKRGDTSQDIYVYADRDRFQEVVDNIIDNAVKYTEKGEVIVSILKKTDDLAAIEVKDTGIGIPKDKVGLLGQKFYRVGNYLDSGGGGANIVRPGGTGLGLYVVFELVKAMGGFIEVESEIGVGSIFTIHIPIYKNQKDKQIGSKKETTFEKFNKLKKQKENKDTEETNFTNTEDEKSPKDESSD